MKRSESSCSSWSARIISFFPISNAVVGAIAVAVPKRIGWPAKHPSPKKSPGPKIATTASLPASFTTESRTPPFWMYNTSLQISPCEKIVSLFRNSVTFRAKLAESRKTWGSKAGFCVDFRWDLPSRERRILGISQPPLRIKAIIFIGLNRTLTIGGHNSVGRVRDAVDFWQQSTHLRRNERRVFRRLDLREG